MPRSLLALAASLIVLPLVSLAGGPSPGAPSSRPAPPELRIQLVHRVLLDRNPKAGTPDEHSMVGPVPPDIQAAGVIPRIFFNSRAVLFLRPDGSVRKQIPLEDDPNLDKSVQPSRNALAIAVCTSFSNRVLKIDDPSYEGGSVAVRCAVYDRDGNLLYTAMGTDEDGPLLGDSGNLMFEGTNTPLLKFMDPRTGALLTDFLFLEDEGGGSMPHLDMSPSGNHIAVSANKARLDNSKRFVPRLPHDVLLRGVSEAWVGMLDGTGRQLWKTKLPFVGNVNRVAVSDDGQLVFAAAEEFFPGPLTTIKTMRFRGFILNGQGQIVVEVPRSGGPGDLGARFHADLGGFVLGNLHTDLVIARPDGSLLRVPSFSRSATDRGVKILSRAIRPGLVALLASHSVHLVLILMDFAGNVLLARVIGGQPTLDRRPSLDRPGHHTSVPLQWEEPQSGPPLLTVGDVRLSPDGKLLSIESENEIRVYSMERTTPTGKGGSR